jgi:cysteinyl-tRNA synthetase
LAELLGLLENDAQQFLQGSTAEGGLSDDEINSLIEQRATAKQEKNWSECDRIRDVLDAEDIMLEDTAEGTRWRRK